MSDEAIDLVEAAVFRGMAAQREIAWIVAASACRGPVAASKPEGTQ